MAGVLSGPMFEPAHTDYWRSVHNKSGGHYNTFALVNDPDGGMEVIRSFYPDAKANEYNLIIFSTSGVHGSYTTIEDIEEWYAEGGVPDGDGYSENTLTFLIIQPRICTTRHGNATVAMSDIPYLKALRTSSAEEFAKLCTPAESSS